MKFLKILILTCFSVFITGYLAFLFVIPNVIDFQKYAPQIQKTIEENTYTQNQLSGLKIQTSYDFSLAVFADKIDFKTVSGEKFAQINNVKIKLSLIPFLRKEIKIDKIEADKLMANIDESMFRQQNPHPKQTGMFKLASAMPDIYVQKYRVSFLKGKDNYTVKGSDFEITDFVLNEKFKIKTVGKVILNKKEQINYNLAVASEIFPQTQKQKNKYDFVEIFEKIYKYDLRTGLTADLTIKNKNGEADISGLAELDKLSFKLAEKTFPPSSLKLKFKGDKVKINASLHVDKGSKALVTGVFKSGKNNLIDLHVKSDKIKIEDVYSILKAFFAPLNIKELNNITAKGILKADFDIKSDFKNIESAGYLKIKNAAIIHNTQKISINNINADVDFSQNSIKINKANALLNSQPIVISGAIDKNAYADILVSAKNLQLKSVLFALGQLKILSENEFSGGLVNLNAVLKGQLKKVTPKVDITAANINLKNKKSNTRLKITKVALVSELKDKNMTQIVGLSMISKSQPAIAVPQLSLNIDKNEITIEKTPIFIGNIKAYMSGKINNLDLTPTLNPVIISIPKQISVPIKGYPNSKIFVKGNIYIRGSLDNPQIKGNINIPLINIPSASTSLRNVTLLADKEILLNCPDIKSANSSMKFSAKINKDFSKGINIQSANFNANLVDLNVLGEILKTLPVGTSDTNFTIADGKNSVEIFKVGGVISNNITSNFYLKNNVLYLNNLRCDAYFGKIAGNIAYHINNQKTELKLQGRGLSADSAMQALTGRDDDIHGKLDFDSNLYFHGHSKMELLKTLNGPLNFIISNGQMGVLGKFEHLIYAQNVLSNSIFRATLNLALKALTVRNTGVYNYMKGQLYLSKGWANITKIKSSGPSMSLYIKGRYHLIDNDANLIILGRIPDDIVNILGPIGEFSMNKMLSFIPKIGEVTNSLIEQFTTNRNYENISEVPQLTIKTYFPTKEFKVIIDGDARKQSSVKSFKWLSKPRVNKGLESSVLPNKPQNQPQQQVPDFVKNLPDFKQ